MALKVFFGFLVASIAFATEEKGLAFLKEKEAEEGVVKLSSGLLYKVLRKGDGKHHPTKDSPCECHYKGTLIDGSEFDSSYRRSSPTTFKPNQVIKGWTEALQLMVEGDHWEIYLPSDLAYGKRGAGAKIPPDAALVFTLELLKIKGNKVEAKTELWGSSTRHLVVITNTSLACDKKHAIQETKPCAELWVNSWSKKGKLMNLKIGLWVGSFKDRQKGSIENKTTASNSLFHHG